MKIIDGKIVLETRPCSRCDGKGEVEQYQTCPNWHKAMRGKACPFCGSTTKQGHSGKHTGIMTICSNCDGKKNVPENLYDYAPESIWQGLAFKVYRQARQNTWNESYLGAGCIYSSEDYGQAAKMDDATIISKVKASGNHQAVKFAKEEDNTLADHIGIFVTLNGYSVRAVFSGVKAVADKIAREPSPTVARIVGGMIAADGGNGTAFAAGL
jgi:RecJ-like exonuclease